MTRSSAVNESLAYVKGFCPHSEPIIEQYINKLENQLNTITKNLGGYRDSDPVSLSENIGIWNKELEKKLEKAKEALKKIEYESTYTHPRIEHIEKIRPIAQKALQEIGE